MRTAQLSLSDTRSAAALRDALSRSGPWQIEIVTCPDLETESVVVIDEAVFDSLPLPLTAPERFVLIARRDADLNRAWESGVVSVVSTEDALPTVLLAVMAAALRVESSARQRNSKRDISQPAVEKLRH